MSVLAWIIVVAIAWMAIAAIVGVFVGRAIRLRDRQVPRQEPVPPGAAPSPSPSGPAPANPETRPRS